ncbi:MAG TPA: hypothetical protein VLJ21_03060 [Candidatus Binatia bacterium]|nr:hypothetical protein [Candidatus Binatia bacterium]
MVKILVGCPTFYQKEYCLQAYADAVHALEGEFDVLIVDNSKDESYTEKIRNVGLPAVHIPYEEPARKRLVDSRNLLRKKVLDEGYDYFFSLEQDVIPQPDALKRLLAAQKPVVTGIYTKHYNLVNSKDERLGVEERPLVWIPRSIKNAPMHKYQLSMNELKPPRLIKAFASGVGCMLIHRSVLEKIAFRWVTNETGFDDMFFCHDLQQNGYPLLADTGVQCGHLDKKWEGIQK